MKPFLNVLWFLCLIVITAAVGIFVFYLGQLLAILTSPLLVISFGVGLLVLAVYMFSSD